VFRRYGPDLSAATVLDARHPVVDVFAESVQPRVPALVVEQARFAQQELFDGGFPRLKRGCPVVRVSSGPLSAACHCGGTSAQVGACSRFQR
jgi:hypothetical protein